VPVKNYDPIMVSGDMQKYPVMTLSDEVGLDLSLPKSELTFEVLHGSLNVNESKLSRIPPSSIKLWM
jgi:hypothetical protein